MMQFLFSEEKCFACILSLFVFFRLYFSAVYLIFRLCRRSRYEGDMSFLDAPDA